MPKFDTLPERITEKHLLRCGADFLKQFYLCSYCFDFYVPAKKLLIEVQGSYFHASPLKYKRSEWGRMQLRNHKRDLRKLAIALNHGYNVIYIWEDDLKHRSRSVRQQLEEILKNPDFKGKRTLLENLFPEYEAFYKVRENL